MCRTVLLQESLSSFNAVVQQLAQDTGCDNLSNKVLIVIFIVVSVFKSYLFVL